MLSHYFRIRSDKGKGLPEKFTADVDSALKFLGFDSSSDFSKASAERDPDFYFYNIFKSHKNRKKKR